MHETSLMEQILASAKCALAPYQVKKVNTIVVRAGRLANVIPGALAMAYEAMSPGSVVDGAELELIEIPITAQCAHCGAHYEAQEVPLICPHCGSRLAEIVGGTEVFLDSIDFEEGD